MSVHHVLLLLHVVLMDQHGFFLNVLYQDAVGSPLLFDCAIEIVDLALVLLALLLSLELLVLFLCLDVGVQGGNVTADLVALHLGREELCASLAGWQIQNLLLRVSSIG